MEIFLTVTFSVVICCLSDLHGLIKEKKGEVNLPDLVTFIVTAFALGGLALSADRPSLVLFWVGMMLVVLIHTHQFLTTQKTFHPTRG